MPTDELLDGANGAAVTKPRQLLFLIQIICRYSMVEGIKHRLEVNIENRGGGQNPQPGLRVSEDPLLQFARKNKKKNFAEGLIREKLEIRSKARKGRCWIPRQFGAEKGERCAASRDHSAERNLGNAGKTHIPPSSNILPQ